MKTGKSILTIGILLGTALLTYGQDLSPKEIIRKADEKFNGEKTSTAIMAMTIVRPTWERTIEFKNWTSGREYSLTLITSPAKDKGQSFLKRQQMFKGRYMKLSEAHRRGGPDLFISIYP